MWRVVGAFVFAGATAVALATTALIDVSAQEPVVGRNTNVMGGPTFITLNPFEMMGDPNRSQNVEPDCDVDSRNPAVIVCSNVDYRLVDFAGVLGGVHLDSWNAIMQSRDGGTTWASRPHPQGPLDSTPGVLKKYQYGFDPQVRFGAAGVMFHVGGVASRDGKLGAIYASTWVHLSDLEDDLEPVRPANNTTNEIVKTNSGQFQDRPSLTVGDQPNGRMCTFDVPRKDGTVAKQTVPCTTAYLTYATFLSNRTKFYFTKTLNGGKGWTQPSFLSESNGIGQFAQIVKVPNSRRLLFFWRRAATPPPASQTAAIMMAVSNNDGDSWSKGSVFRELCDFDQETTPTRFRFRSMPQATADGTGKVYVVWHERPRDPATGQCTLADSRVFLATTDGAATTTPSMVDDHNRSGHQIFPAVAASAGQVHVAWMDFRNDASGRFEEGLDEQNSLLNENPTLQDPKRHTADMYARQGPAAGLGVVQNPSFGQPSFQLSRYAFGIADNGTQSLEQLNFNVVFARNFGGMLVPFHGDMNSNRGESIVPKDPIREPGVWTYNGATGSPILTPVFHSFWTDGRHLKLFSNEPYVDAQGNPVPRPYTPPDFSLQDPTLPAHSLYDPTQPKAACDPNNSMAGTKNLEIYTARTTQGLYAFAPWNNKALIRTTEAGGVEPMQRAFVVVVQNTVPAPRDAKLDPTPYRLRIAAAAPGTIASWKQFDPTQSQEDVFVAAGTAIARTLYVSHASNPRAAVSVRVEELTSIPGGEVKPGGRQTTIFINPDPSAPLNPLRPGNVDQTAEEFDIDRFEVHDIVISNAEKQDINAPDVKSQAPDISDWNDWLTPRWENPRWENPRWENPRWENPRWENPRWENPRWENDGWENYTISDVEGGSYRHISAAYTNTGNTTSAYDVRVVANGVDATLKLQLVAYKLYATTGQHDCEFSLVGNTQVLVNIPDYDASPSNLNSPPPPDPQNTTIQLHPGETVYTTLVAFDPDSEEFDENLDVNTVLFAARPQAVNTIDAENGVTVPPIVFNGSALLEFTTSGQPTNTFVNTPLGLNNEVQGVQVLARNTQGAAIPNLVVTIALGANPSSATLSGTLTRTTNTFGVATFDDLTIDKSGVGYTLVASGPKVTGATSALFTISALTGFVDDPAADATGVDGEATNDPLADLLSAALTVDGGLQIDVVFTSVDASTSLATVALDVDQNVATGHQGLDEFCEIDNGLIGADYLITIGSAGSTPARVYRYNGTCNSFTQVGTVPVTALTDGYRVIVPLSLLGDDDGRLNFKVVSALQVTPTGYTGIRDVMPNIGSAPGQVPTPPPPVIGLFFPSHPTHWRVSSVPRPTAADSSMARLPILHPTLRPQEPVPVIDRLFGELRLPPADREQRPF